MRMIPCAYYNMPLQSPNSSMSYVRTSPCFLSLEPKEFDCLVRSLLCAIQNGSLGDSTWSQISLPIQSGGLGIQCATQLAPSAYLASAVGSEGLVRQLVHLGYRMLLILLVHYTGLLEPGAQRSSTHGPSLSPSEGLGFSQDNSHSRVFTEGSTRSGTSWQPGERSQGMVAGPPDACRHWVTTW